MTTKQFRELCEQVLVPMVLKALKAEMREQKDVLATISRDVLRVRDELEALVFTLANDDDAVER